MRKCSVVSVSQKKQYLVNTYAAADLQQDPCTVSDYWIAAYTEFGMLTKVSGSRCCTTKRIRLLS